MAVPNEPPYVKATSVIFTEDGDTVIITVRPQFSNVFQYNKNRVFINDGSRTFVKRDDNWPKYNVINFQLSGVTALQVSQLETFLRDKLGLLVSVTVDNVDYIGVITNPNIEVGDERDDNCTYNVSFSVETEDDI